MSDFIADVSPRLLRVELLSEPVIDDMETVPPADSSMYVTSMEVPRRVCE